MAFPSTVGTKPDTLSDAWEGARSTAGLVKLLSQNLKALSLAGNVPSSNIKNYLTELSQAKTILVRYGAVPGLAAYAQAQVNDNTLDVSASFTAMINAIDACGSWVLTNFPKDASGYLLAEQWNANGTTVDRLFSTATLANFRTQLDGLIATID